MKFDKNLLILGIGIFVLSRLKKGTVNAGVGVSSNAIQQTTPIKENRMHILPIETPAPKLEIGGAALELIQGLSPIDITSRMIFIDGEYRHPKTIEEYYNTQLAGVTEIITPEVYDYRVRQHYPGYSWGGNTPGNVRIADRL